MKIVNEDGINWCHFTEYELIGDDKIRILHYYRLHKGDYSDWPEKCQQAPYHDQFHAMNIWLETKERTVIGYRVPGEKDFREVVNPKYIFDYK